MRWVVVGMACLFLIVVAGCKSDVERVREANETAEDSTVISASISVYDLQPGDCISSLHIVDVVDAGVESEEVKSAILVPCFADWKYRVLNSFVLSIDGEYPGHLYFDAQVEARCDRYTTYYIYPFSGGWEEGDRRIVCLEEYYAW